MVRFLWISLTFLSLYFAVSISLWSKWIRWDQPFVLHTFSSEFNGKIQYTIQTVPPKIFVNMTFIMEPSSIKRWNLFHLFQLWKSSRSILQENAIIVMDQSSKQNWRIYIQRKNASDLF